MHDRHITGADYFLLDAPYWPGRRVILSDEPNMTEVKSDLATLDASYAISCRLRLSSVINYSEVSYRDSYDSDWSAQPGGSGGAYEPAKTLSQEVRLNFDFGRLKGLIGGYYSHEDKRGAESEGTQRVLFSTVGIDQQLVAPPPAGFGLDQATANYVMDLYPGRGADIY